MTKTLRRPCPGCGRDLPYSSYHKHAGRPGGLETRCKDCTQEAERRRAALKAPAVSPPPRPQESLLPRHKAMIRQTADAFEAFYNEFTNERLGGLPAHAKAWVQAALSNKRLLLNVPPRHAKTTIMAIWFPIWQLACSRDTQVLIVSKTTKHGEKIARKIANELGTNVKLIEAFGRFQPIDSARPWRVTAGELEIEGKDLSLRSGDLNIQIRGSGQQILGMEADWVIGDDITDRRVAVSEADREKEWDFWLGDVMTRLSPDARAFCIGQRVHSEDIYGRLQREVGGDGLPSWHLERSPAILDELEETVLWPEEWPYKKLMESRRSVGSSMFQCMYQQAPDVAGDFVPKWFITGNGTPEVPGCLDYDRSVGAGWRNPQGQYFPVTRVISIDPSPTMFAGIIVADVVYVPQARDFWCSIVDIRRDKMGLRQMLNAIEEMTTTHSPSVCIFESNSAKWLREDPAWNRIAPMFLHVVAHTTARNKSDKLLGVWSLAADFEAGRIRLPYETREDRDCAALLIDEVLAYPSGQTDDVLMALWFIKFNYRSLIPREALQTRFRERFPGEAPQGYGWAWNGEAAKQREKVSA